MALSGSPVATETIRDDLNLRTNKKLRKALDKWRADPKCAAQLGCETLTDVPEAVLFSSRFVKVNRRGKRQDRDIVVTSLAILNFKPGSYGSWQRRFLVADMDSLVRVSDSQEVLIHAWEHSGEYDYWIDAKNNELREAFVRAVVAAYEGITGQTLAVVDLERNLAESMMVTRPVAESKSQSLDSDPTVGAARQDRKMSIATRLNRGSVVAGGGGGSGGAAAGASRDSIAPVNQQGQSSPSGTDRPAASRRGTQAGAQRSFGANAQRRASELHRPPLATIDPVGGCWPGPRDGLGGGEDPFRVEPPESVFGSIIDVLQAGLQDASDGEARTVWTRALHQWPRSKSLEAARVIAECVLHPDGGRATLQRASADDRFAAFLLRGTAALAGFGDEEEREWKAMDEPKEAEQDPNAAALEQDVGKTAGESKQAPTAEIRAAGVRAWMTRTLWFLFSGFSTQSIASSIVRSMGGFDRCAYRAHSLHFPCPADPTWDLQDRTDVWSIPVEAVRNPSLPLETPMYRALLEMLLGHTHWPSEGIQGAETFGQPIAVPSLLSCVLRMTPFARTWALRRDILKDMNVLLVRRDDNYPKVLSVPDWQTWLVPLLTVCPKKASKRTPAAAEYLKYVMNLYAMLFNYVFTRGEEIGSCLERFFEQLRLQCGGWTTDAVGVARSILTNLLVKIGNGSKRWREQFDRQEWSGLFAIARVIEDFIFYRPVTDTFTPQEQQSHAAAMGGQSDGLDDYTGFARGHRHSLAPLMEYPRLLEEEDDDQDDEDEEKPTAATEEKRKGRKSAVPHKDGGKDASNRQRSKSTLPAAHSAVNGAAPDGEGSNEADTEAEAQEALLPTDLAAVSRDMRTVTPIVRLTAEYRPMLIRQPVAQPGSGAPDRSNVGLHLDLSTGSSPDAKLARRVFQIFAKVGLTDDPDATTGAAAGRKKNKQAKELWEHGSNIYRTFRDICRFLEEAEADRDRALEGLGRFLEKRQRQQRSGFLSRTANRHQLVQSLQTNLMRQQAQRTIRDQVQATRAKAKAAHVIEEDSVAPVAATTAAGAADGGEGGAAEVPKVKEWVRQHAYRLRGAKSGVAVRTAAPGAGSSDTAADGDGAAAMERAMRAMDKDNMAEEKEGDEEEEDEEGEGIGSNAVCSECEQLLLDDPGTRAMGSIYHEDCFTCATCMLPLVEKDFWVDGGEPLCRRDFLARVGTQVCAGCMLPFCRGDRAVEAVDKLWHPWHLACECCQHVFSEDESFLEQDGFPYCNECFENLFLRCPRCEVLVEESDDGIFALDKNWHRECFTCEHCHCGFPGGIFFVKEERPYCEDHFLDLFAPKCVHCNLPIKTDGLAACGASWHVSCFTCVVCGTDFPGGKFFEVENRPYCEEHYWARFGKKCGVCEKIIEGEIYNAMDSTFHPDCFVCAECHRPFEDQQYFAKEGKPYCREDFTRLFCERCPGCGEYVVEEALKALGGLWHPECLVCSEPSCGISLDGRVFRGEDGKAYCEEHYMEKFGNICAGCGEKIAGRMLKAADKEWHPECFRCSQPGCTVDLAEAGRFRINDGNVYCVEHHLELFANRCADCGEPIPAGQELKVFGAYYHRACLKCSMCRKEMAPQDKLAKSPDDKPLCVDCFVSHFAERCGGCGEPITGQFLKVLERKYHKDCLGCAVCGTPFGEGDQMYIREGWPVCGDHTTGTIPEEARERMSRRDAEEAERKARLEPVREQAAAAGSEQETGVAAAAGGGGAATTASQEGGGETAAPSPGGGGGDQSLKKGEEDTSSESRSSVSTSRRGKRLGAPPPPPPPPSS